MNQALSEMPNFEPDTTGSEETEGQAAEATVWDNDTLQKVSAFADKMDEIKKQRDQTNADKAAAVAELVSLGFNKEALKAALHYRDTPEDKRENFDLSYIYARKAFGQPIQDDLFTAALQQHVKAV